jgi:hypothetical protein
MNIGLKVYLLFVQYSDKMVTNCVVKKNISIWLADRSVNYVSMPPVWEVINTMCMEAHQQESSNFKQTIW